ncbi:MAG: GAF domain-containing protein [Bacteroidetes bacterium]|nr:GAF domain-containing protein [Bacteroidota bacterium]
MEQIDIAASSKEEIYRQLLPQIESLLADETDRIANMANTVAALRQSFPYYSWVGFYLFDATKNELVLGPFQGKIACTRIAVGRGVCGTAFNERKSIVVPDVNQFPGHIFCDGDSKSEIVVPIHWNGSVIGVLDVDSHAYNSFDETDRIFLESLIGSIAGKIAPL